MSSIPISGSPYRAWTPLPHQLEAVYDHLLKLPSVRFLLAEDRPDCFWLYVVTNCATAPELQEPIKDPALFRCHEVTKVQHYLLNVNALKQPMEVREDDVPYGGKERP